MKKFFLLFVTLLLAAVAANAECPQDKPDPKMLKEIQEYKIKFLAQEMELKPDQKEQFVTVYQKLSAEKQSNFERMRALEAKLRNNPSEADYKAATEAMADIRVKDAALEKKYDAEFAKFLSSKQIYKMKEGEEKFRRKMMDMHHKRKQEKNGHAKSGSGKGTPGKGNGAKGK
ncbi:MAG: hypothetical protein K2O78_06415 [Muribaculaceae bacterium]|nr:hypothetical protein [Muribaculaceae bacterium]MDE7081269.1 hypothetical protein [Muribaculaceae bacterium]